jgi:hypothetical protein
VLARTGRVTVLTREDAVGLETVTEVRGEWHKVHACLVETAIYDLKVSAKEMSVYDRTVSMREEKS